MRRDLVNKGRSLGGSSDLTLLAPIRPGLVDALEAVTYKTRIKRVLEALQGARTTAHELQPVRLLSDAVERVGAIQSVRVAVLEPEDKVLLAVSFDGSWESYIRVLWEKVGTLLDLIFCGTEGYVTAADHSYTQWLEWARRVQVETGFYYGPPGASARDVVVNIRSQAMRTRGRVVDQNGQRQRIDETEELRASAPDAETETARLLSLAAPRPGDPSNGGAEHVRMVRERMRNGLQALAGLYRLTDLHPPGTPDGTVLRRAALDLLLEFVQAHDSQLIQHVLDDEYDKGADKGQGRFLRQLDWLFPGRTAAAAWVRPRPKAPANEGLSAEQRAPVQGGILRAYNGSTHAVVLLLALPTAQVAADFLAWARSSVNSDSSADYGKALQVNLSFTPQGLRAAGLDDDALDLFPEAFRQGMAARSGLLGDLHENHPRRWRLPRGFDGVDKPSVEARGVELDAVHAVLQLRTCATTDAGRKAVDLSDKAHPLRDAVKRLKQALPHVQILSAQSLRRRFDTTTAADSSEPPIVREHFGYADGNGQPDVEPPESGPRYARNRVHLGEIVNGHDNATDERIDPEDTRYPAPVRERERWLADGSFLVMRKYRQHVGRLESAVQATAEVMAATFKDPNYSEPVCREIVYGKLMGRLRNGAPMVNPGETDPARQNVFDYADDTGGRDCPLGAHVRKANPRQAPAGTRMPRLMRRSMSFGPERPAGVADDGAERGLLFMAYNADIGQQFEVVQRWLVGGNPTGIASGAHCPIVGIAAAGQPRVFAFEHEGQVFRVVLSSESSIFDTSSDPVRLQWGLYLFAPSLPVLDRLHSCAASAAARTPAQPVPWNLNQGRQALQGLLELESTACRHAVIQAWKAAVEDPEAIDRLHAAAIWAAIRTDHHGLLRTGYGVLVADRDLIHGVYLDPDERYSVSGQFERMKQSFGEISLGLDQGPEYRQQSEPINTEIGKLTEADTFKLAFDAAHDLIDRIAGRAVKQALDAGDARFEVGLDAREVADEVLATLSEAWFGLNQTSGHFRRGSMDWKWQEGQPPLYPGHFTALSRYMFQPHPGDMPTDLGQRYGRALRTAMRGFVAQQRAHGGFQAPLAKAIFEHPVFGKDDDFVARNMVGVLMGFNPTIIGAVLNVLREWQRDGTFAQLRLQLQGKTAHADVAPLLRAPLAAAARMRPMPQLGWRTVRQAHRLGPAGTGGVDLGVGDVLVLAHVSGMQQSQADGQSDHRIMFGGVRDWQPGGRPTHACPGYEAGMGAIMGTVTAILTRKENLRPGSAPLAYVLDGPSEPAVVATRQSRRPAAATKTAQARQPGQVMPHHPVVSVGRAVMPAARTAGRVLGWGDSWLDYRLAGTPLELGTDLRDWLETPKAPFGFRAPTAFCVWTDWPLIETMAANPKPFCEFLRNELQLRPPRAILLSGGGNDSTEKQLENLINAKGSGSGPALDPVKLDAHIRKLRGHYVKVLEALAEVFDDSREGPVPVFVHGYDYPLPRGAGSPFRITRWMFDPFTRQGYDLGKRTDFEVARLGMRQLIDRFNDDCLAALEKQFGFMHHVDLRGMLEEKYQDTEKAWANDLHPQSEAFGVLAAKIATEIRDLAP